MFNIVSFIFAAVRGAIPFHIGTCLIFLVEILCVIFIFDIINQEEEHN